MPETYSTISELPDYGSVQGTDRIAVDRLGAAVAAGAFVVDQAYQIVTVGSTNFAAIGAASNTVGAYFVATGAGTGSGTAAPINTGDAPLSAVAALLGAGPAATVSVGTVTTGAAGSSAAVTNVGTSSAAVFNFAIPRGDPGGGGGGSGTVTSVGLVAPTGFSVGGSPVTGSGNITLSFDAGYSLPLDSSQANWNTAFSERLRWDGSSTGLNATTARTSLGLGTLATQSGTFSGTSSGTNTGDNAVNTLYSGLVSNANHTGDASGSTVLTLATVNTNLGSFGSATAAPTFTVNAKGLITAASSTTITPAVSSIAGLGADVATALAVNVGSTGAPVVLGGAGGTPSSITLTSGTGLPLATGVTGVLPVANGGTGTTAPGLVAGANVSISGTWPNQTISASGDGGGFNPASPGAIGGTTAGAGSFTALSASTSLLLPNTAGSAARHLYTNANTLRYRDSGNVERLLLNSADNLANLANAATARSNLGAASAEGAVTAVTHGSNASTARPSGVTAVYWIGTVEPVNAVNGDLWIGGI
jgi:hypothetical protein